MQPTIKYLTPLELEHAHGESDMMVSEDFSVQHNDLILTTPKGFITDGASIPRFFWRVIGGPFGRYRTAAVPHDAAYRGELIVTHLGRPIPRLARCTADEWFLDIMRYEGIAPWKRRVMWWAVRHFGGRSWKVDE
jgi:hypothetical protein